MSPETVSTNLARIIKKNEKEFHPLIKFDAKKDRFHLFDFSEQSKLIPTKEIIAETLSFSEWVNDTLISSNATYGIGGYKENRVLYRRSDLFGGEESRSVHLGIDIWGPAGTPVYAPMGGMVHSFKFNDQFGDYGATIILLHQLETISFYTLYGHLSLADLAQTQEGAYINRGQVIGHFGPPEENGHWPPHLHFQVIENMEFKEGDYPGVCKPSETPYYFLNCPDPTPMLGFQPNF
jgi:murein DD-endopeptidase MepM/ murein hydrolase activator NlpD